MSAVSEYHSVKCSACTKRVSAEGSESNLMKKLQEVGWKKLSSTDFRCKSHVNTKIVAKAAPAAAKKTPAKKAAVKSAPKSKAVRFGSIPAPVSSPSSEGE